MKTSIFKLLSLLIIFSLIISCKNEDNSSQKIEDSNTSQVIENIQEKEKKNDGAFKVKSGIIHYYDKNLKGEKSADYKLFFDNFGRLIKLEETIDGQTSNYLYDEDAKKGATQFAGRDKVNKIFMRQGEISRFVAKRSTSGFTKKKNESLIGKECEVYENNAKDDNGDSKLIYWTYKGIVLKEINKLGSGYHFEANKFEEKTIDKETFSLLEKVK